MNRKQLLEKIKLRKIELDMTLNNIAKLSKLGNRTVTRFFNGQDVKLSTLEKITNLMGLDFAGNIILDSSILKENRAKERALYIVSLVQDTSSLENQGLDNSEIEKLIDDTKNQFLTGKYQKNLWES
jgi:transcriptional regulator with XRE-family HTH domain